MLEHCNGRVTQMATGRYLFPRCARFLAVEAPHKSYVTGPLFGATAAAMRKPRYFISILINNQQSFL